MGLMQSQMDQMSRTQVLNQSTFTTGGIIKKKNIVGFNQTVANIVKKEIQKRHESPRSRRQVLSNIAAQNRKGIWSSGI